MEDSKIQRRAVLLYPPFLGGCFEASVCHRSRYKPSTCHHRPWFASDVDAVARTHFVCSTYMPYIYIWEFLHGVDALGDAWPTFPPVLLLKLMGMRGASHLSTPVLV